MFATVFQRLHERDVFNNVSNATRYIITVNESTNLTASAKPSLRRGTGRVGVLGTMPSSPASNEPPSACHGVRENVNRWERPCDIYHFRPNKPTVRLKNNCVNIVKIV